MLVGGTILIFILILPLEDLAHFADTVLLLVLILVNIALIIHRKKFPDIERPFKVPLVPVLPALGVLANLYLLWQIAHHPMPMILAFICLLLGMVGFLAWKGTQSQEEAIPGTPSKIALGRYAVSSDENKYRVLVPLANPSTVVPLMQLASAIAAERNGEVIALRVAVLPEQMPLADTNPMLEEEKHVLELAHAEAEKHGVTVSSLLVVGHHAGRAILEAGRKHQCNLILMGWKGYTTSAQKILGEDADAVVTHARSDIMLVKFGGEEKVPTRFILPTAGGEHALAAEKYAADISRHVNGELAVCSIAKPNLDAEGKTQISERLQAAADRIILYNDQKAEEKIITHESIPEGVIEAAEEYDAIVIGATKDSIYPQIVFGSIPEKIAKNAGKTVIVVKHYHAVKALFGRVVGE